MSDKTSNIRQAIQSIAHSVKPGSSLFVAEITAVAETDCTVKLGEMELTKVRLFSQPTEAGNLLLKPQVGSMAIIADLSKGDLRDLVVIQADKLDTVQYLQGELTVLIDGANGIVKIENGLTLLVDGADGKLSVFNDSKNLKDLFVSLKDIIQTLTVSTPAGPSGTPLPPTLTKLTTFETDFNSLLK